MIMSSPSIYKTPGNYQLPWLVFHIFLVTLWEDYGIIKKWNMVTEKLETPWLDTVPAMVFPF